MEQNQPEMPKKGEGKSLSALSEVSQINEDAGRVVDWVRHRWELLEAGLQLEDYQGLCTEILQRVCRTSKELVESTTGEHLGNILKQRPVEVLQLVRAIENDLFQKDRVTLPPFLLRTKENHTLQKLYQLVYLK